MTATGPKKLPERAALEEIFAHLVDVIEGVDFINGIKPSQPDQAAA